MQAINHVATALILKRAVPAAPLVALVLSTELVEFFWVLLNLLDIEMTRIAAPMASVADIHLHHMPYSHSILADVVIAVLAGGLAALWFRPVVALAIAAGVLSHIVLDLFVHAPDIPLHPGSEGPHWGTGLYANAPLLALGIETLWGLLCWRLYQGSKTLLVVILGLNLASLPFYTAAINLGEAALSGQSTVFALIVLFQIVLSSCLLIYFADREAT